MAGYALAGAAGYGASDFIGGVASRKHRVPVVLALSQTTSFALMVLAALALPGTLHRADLARGGVAGLLVFAGIALVYAAFSRGDIGPAAALLGVFSALVPVLVALVTGAVFGSAVAVGFVAAGLSIVAFADGRREERSWTSLSYAVGAGAAFGAYQVTMSETAPDGGMWPLLAAQLVVVVCSLGWFFATRGSGALRPPPLAVLAGAVEAAGSVAALWAVRTGNLAVVGVILALAPAMSVVLARVVLGERMTLRRLAGLAAAGLAVAVLAGAA